MSAWTADDERVLDSTDRPAKAGCVRTASAGADSSAVCRISATATGGSTVYNNKMRKLLFTTIAGLLILGLTTLAPAQAPRKSPHESALITVNGHKITVTYGRPYMNKRTIMGGLVPYGQVWRTGADEATTLSTDVDLDINGLKVPKGVYALFTIPKENSWTLIVNKTAKQWGAFSYKDASDLGRADMTVSKAGSPVEQFTISLTPEGSSGATMKMAWENTVASVPIKLAP